MNAASYNENIFSLVLTDFNLMNLSAILTPAFTNISVLAIKGKSLNCYLIFTPLYITKFSNLEELKLCDMGVPFEVL